MAPHFRRIALAQGLLPRPIAKPGDERLPMAPPPDPRRPDPLRRVPREPSAEQAA